MIMFVLMMLIGIIIGIFLDRLIPSKEEKIEKEYIKVFKDAIEKDLEQETIKKKNSNKI